MRNVYIIGADTIKYGNYINVSHKELTRMTVEPCLQDAGITKSDLESVYFGNSLWGHSHGQHSIRGHLAMRAIGIDSIPIVNVEAACATGSLCLHLAYKDILTGLYECSLAVGVEKILSKDKVKTLTAFNTYIDTENHDAYFSNFNNWIDKNVKLKAPEFEQKERSPFMDLYGGFALHHMDRFGTTQEQLAIAASKNHYHSSLNPKAQYQFEVPVEKVLSDYIVSWPLTRSMCAPVGDGASSAIVCSEEFLKKLPASIQKRAVKISASIFISGDDTDMDVRPNANQKAAQKAYEMAGIGPEDISLAEVHDATIVGEIMQIENMGFCPIGQGGPFTASGATRLGGKLPVNTSGGLVSRGHPVAASGLGMIYELVTQLRGEAGPRQVKNAKYALCENGGGAINFREAAIAITILQA